MSERQNWSMLAAMRAAPPTTLKVGVVGAGLAGLVAARLLHDSGFDVTVFEARDRIGGRIWTDTSTLGVPIDFGGSWIHGADDNPLTDWCESLGIRVVESATERSFYVDPLDPLPQRTVLRRAWRSRLAGQIAISAALLRQRIAGVVSKPGAVSLQDVVGPLLETSMLSDFDRRVLALTVSSSEGIQGAPADRLAIEEYFPSESYAVNAMPEGGFARLIDDAARGLEIHLAQPIRRIDWDWNGVVLHDDEVAHRVDYAVVAVPLGLLKQGLPGFHPALPQGQAGAIARIGYGDGVLGKLYIRFPHRFWPDNIDRLGSLPPTPQRRGRFTTWFSIERETAMPILVGFANGHAAIELDRNASDEEVLAIGMGVLRGMFAGQVPEPVSFHFTRWLSDPWAAGSYSYPAIGSSPQDRLAHRDPVAGRLFFAGEATEPVSYGTVHAALQSGERVAEAIFKSVHARDADRARRPWRAR